MPTDMQVSVEIEATFRCSLERAFKAPILGDATRFLSGYFLQPAITAFEDDATWGKVGGVRFPVTNGNFLVQKGRICKDEVLCRNENSYWQWTVYDFKTWTLFFTNRGVGEWFVEQNDRDSIGVRYVYTYNSINPIFHLFSWLFSKIQMRGLMQKAIKGIREQAESGEPFYYEARDRSI